MRLYTVFICHDQSKLKAGAGLKSKYLNLTNYGVYEFSLDLWDYTLGVL